MDGFPQKSENPSGARLEVNEPRTEYPIRAPSAVPTSPRALAAALVDLQFKMDEVDVGCLDRVSARDFILIASSVWRQTGDLSRAVRFTSQAGVVTVAKPPTPRPYAQVAAIPVAAKPPTKGGQRRRSSQLSRPLHPEQFLLPGPSGRLRCP